MKHLEKTWPTLLENPHVRDLAWSIFSPSLLSEEAAVKAMTNGFLGLDTPSFEPLVNHIKKLNINPEPLLKAMQEIKMKRLGDYFEFLIGYFLNQMPCCHKLENKILLKNGPTTVGEFDFLFFSDLLQHMVHWEVAVKFYLLDPKGVFRGLNPEDTLEDKIITLSRQVMLPQKSEGKRYLQAHNFLPIESGCLVKGYLFYPLDETYNYETKPAHGVNDKHLHGWWDYIGSERWKKRTKDFRLVHPSKFDCLSPRLYNSEPPPFEMGTGLVACLVQEEGQWREVERGMIVSQNWPHSV